jgi:hypothetical protein
MSSDSDINGRLNALEERMARIEELLTGCSPETDEGLNFTFEEIEPPLETASATAQGWITPKKRAGARPPVSRGKQFPVTEVLGWAGVMALVLAATSLLSSASTLAG